MPEPGVTHLDSSAEYYFEEGCYISELHNDPADPELSIARARVRPGDITRWHRLQATTERYIIIRGTGVVYVGDMAPTEVSEGDVVNIPPLTPQRIKNTGNEDLLFLAICTPRFRPENYQDIDEGS